MKYFIVICGVLALAHAESLKDYANKLAEKVLKGIEVCADEINISADTMEELTKREVPKSHEGMCVIACLYKHGGMMGADGNYDSVMAVKHIEGLKDIDMDTYNKMVNVAATCGKIEMNSDICIRATDLVTCAIEEANKVGITKDLLGL